MTDRIYPKRVAFPVTPLGYDGSDFRAIEVGTDGKPLVWRVNLNELWHNPSFPSVGGDMEIPAGTGETERWSYTVPSGRKAILHGVSFWVDHPTASGECGIFIVIRDRRCGGLLFDTNTEMVYRMGWINYQILMNAGNKLSIRTLNTTSANVWMRVGAIITEYE